MQDSLHDNQRWEALADVWDERMGEHSNEFHREIIRPDTEKFLDINTGDLVLDAACGNGNFSRRLAEIGAEVIAFDYSPKLIEHAKQRCKQDKNIQFFVADATDLHQLVALKQDRKFDKAVCNMAVMDIADIKPLFSAIFQMLKPGGIFVFSGVHPCFQTPRMKKIVETTDYAADINIRIGIQTFEYIKPCHHEVVAFSNEPRQVPVFHFHRSLSEILSVCFKTGFVMDGLAEPVFAKKEGTALTKFDWYEIPPAVIIRLRKI